MSYISTEMRCSGVCAFHGSTVSACLRARVSVGGPICSCDLLSWRERVPTLGGKSALDTIRGSIKGAAVWAGTIQSVAHLKPVKMEHKSSVDLHQIKGWQVTENPAKGLERQLIADPRHQYNALKNLETYYWSCIDSYWSLLKNPDPSKMSGIIQQQNKMIRMLSRLHNDLKICFDTPAIAEDAFMCPPPPPPSNAAPPTRPQTPYEEEKTESDNIPDSQTD